MSSERVLPGVYIREDPTGLIGVPSVAGFNGIIVGTARSGPILSPQLLGSARDAEAMFGAEDDWDNPETPDNPLSLVRLFRVFKDAGGGAAQLIRIANASGTDAALQLFGSPYTGWANVALKNGANTVITLYAGYAGKYANGNKGIAVEISADAADDALYKQDNDSQVAFSVDVSVSQFEDLQYPVEYSTYNKVSCGSGPSVYYAGSSLIQTDACYGILAAGDAIDPAWSGIADSVLLDGGNVGGGSQEFVAQKFRVYDACTITKVDLALKYNTQFSAGNVKVSIRAVAASGDPSSTDLVYKEVDATTLALSGSYAKKSFTFDTPYNLTAGTEYFIVITLSGSPTASDEVYVGIDNTASNYGDGSYYQSTDNEGTWTETATSDCIFDARPSPTNAVAILTLSNANNAGSGTGVGRVSFATTPDHNGETTDFAEYVISSSNSSVHYVKVSYPADNPTIIEEYNVVTGDNLYDVLEDGNDLYGPSLIVQPVLDATYGNYDIQPMVKTTMSGGANGSLASPSDVSEGWTEAEGVDGYFCIHHHGREPKKPTGDYASDMAQMVADMASHLNKMEGTSKERIGYTGMRLGLTGETKSNYITNASDSVKARMAAISDDRVTFCVPGMKRTDRQSGSLVTLSGVYHAAAEAGLDSSNPAHVSGTNKVVVGVVDLEHKFIDEELETLIKLRCRTASLKNGIRCRKAITTGSGIDVAYEEQVARRVTDMVRLLCRAAADPFIGEKNTRNNRNNLRNVQEAVLGQLLIEGYITSYDIDVYGQGTTVNADIGFQPALPINKVNFTLFPTV